MTAPVTLVIHYDIASTSTNAISRVGHFERARRAGDAKLAALQALAEARFPEHDGPVRLDYLARRARAMDDDSVVSGAKWIRDMLCSRTKNGKGIVPNDSVKFVRLGTITQEIAPHWKGKEQLCVTITPLEDPAP